MRKRKIMQYKNGRDKFENFEQLETNHIYNCNWPGMVRYFLHQKNRKKYRNCVQDF